MRFSSAALVNQFDYDTSPAHSASLDTTAILSQAPLFLATRQITKYISNVQAKDMQPGIDPARHQGPLEVF